MKPNYKQALPLLLVSLAIIACCLNVESETVNNSPKSRIASSVRVSAPSDCFISLKCPRKLSVAQLDHEIILHPNDPALYICRGDNFLNEGSYEKASADFNKVLKLDPESCLAHVGKSRTLRALGTMSEVFGELEKARLHSSAENFAKLLWECAYLHRELKQYDIALKEYKQLNKLKLSGNSAQAYALFQTGETLIRLGKINDGMAYFDGAKRLDPLIRLEEPRAQVHYVLKEYKLSIDDYTSAIKQILAPRQSPAFDDNLEHLPELYRQRAAVYKAIGRKDLQARDLNLAARAQQQTFDDAPFRSR